MFTAALRYIKWDQLSETERERLRKILEEQKKLIQDALDTVNQDLETLTGTPKRKRTVKRKAKRGRR
jgi:transcriptional regulator of heat shock response